METASSVTNEFPLHTYIYTV